MNATQTATRSTLDAATLARVNAASQRRAAKLAAMTPTERADEARRTAPIANNRPFSLFKVG